MFKNISMSQFLYIFFVAKLLGICEFEVKVM